MINDDFATALRRRLTLVFGDKTPVIRHEFGRVFIGDTLDVAEGSITVLGPAPYREMGYKVFLQGSGAPEIADAFTLDKLVEEIVAEYARLQVRKIAQ